MDNISTPINFTIFNLIKNNNVHKHQYNIKTNKIKKNDFHDDIMNIICSETYLQNGVLADINDIEENYGWFIVSTIYFETKLTDEIMLWKYNESENKWYEKTINARLLLQLNGT